MISAIELIAHLFNWKTHAVLTCEKRDCETVY